MQSATTMVPMAVFGAKESLIWGCLCAFLLGVLMRALSQFPSPHMAADILWSHHTSSFNQYESCWEPFQRLVASCLIMYMFQDTVFQFLSSVSDEKL